jgi:hypothetical protein
MTKQHPITPPPELVEQWWDGTHGAFYEFEAVTSQAARWGADQELEACLAWIANRYGDESHVVSLLRAARRPKPPSLKEQALKELRVIHETFAHQGLGNKTPALDAALKRLGELEALDD